MIPFSTVFQEDPTAVVVIAASVIDEFYNGIRNRSSRVVAAVTDHTGQALVMAGSGCSLKDSVSTLSKWVHGLWLSCCCRAAVMLL